MATDMPFCSDAKKNQNQVPSSFAKEKKNVLKANLAVLYVVIIGYNFEFLEFTYF